MSVIVPILSTFNDKGIKSAVREFKTATTTIGKFGAVGKIFEGVGKSLTKNVTAPIIAVGGAITLLVRESMEAQAVQHRLAQLLRTTGGATEDQIEILLKQAAALEKVGVVSKENVMVVQSQLATFDLQASTIAKLTPAILDYVTAEKGATASADDFRSMTNGLAQALNGQFGSLTRAGFVIDDNTKKMISNGTEAERAAGIVQVLGSTYDGFNESLRQTPEGRLIALQLEFASLREELGTALTPIFLDVVDILREDLLPTLQSGATTVGNFFKAFSELDEQTKKNIIQFIGIVAVAGPVLVVIGAIIKGVVALSKAFILLTKSKLLIPIAIAAVIGAFRAQSDSQYQLAKETGSTWLQIARVVELGIENILFVVENLINGFKVAGLAIDHFGRIVNNAFKIAGGQLPDSLMSFDERLQSLVKHSFVDLTSGIGGLTSVVGDFQSSLSAIENAVKDVDISAVDLENQLASLNVATDTNTKVLEKNKDKADKLKDTMIELKKAIVDLKQQAVDKLKESLTHAMRELESATASYDSFKKRITDSLTSTIDFGKAAEDGNFVSGLVGQAKQAKEFAAQIKTLIKMGLSEKAIQEILKQGAVAGSKIADEIIAGGQTIVKKVNKLMSSVEKVATDVGTLGANQFYLAGVTQGQALVNGILAALAAGQEELLAAQNALATGSAVNTNGFPGGALQQSLRDEATRTGNTAALAMLNEFTQNGTGVVSARELEQLQEAGIGGGLTHPSQRAVGGLTLGGRPYLVGEHGPELFMPGQTGMITPNHRLGSGMVLNVYAGIGTDGMQVGRQIVDAIKRFEKQSGPVFASV